MRKERSMAQNQQDPQKTIMILLGVVVVLLVAIVGIFVYTGQQKAVPAVGATSGSSLAVGTTGSSGGVNTGTGQPTQSNPGMAPSTATPFDAKTATKVPAGTTPQAFVSAYYQNIIDKKYDVAFKMQPASSQQGTVADFTATQQGYGMVSFKVVSTNVVGDTATVDIEQNLGSNGLWGALWTIKKVGADWYVESRKISMK
jgi:flagellar basal body-associated protein FliL